MYHWFVSSSATVVTIVILFVHKNRSMLLTYSVSLIFWILYGYGIAGNLGHI